MKLAHKVSKEKLARPVQKARLAVLDRRAYLGYKANLDVTDEMVKMELLDLLGKEDRKGRLARWVRKAFRVNKG